MQLLPTIAVLFSAALAAQAATVVSPAYDPFSADQFQTSRGDDVAPADPAMRTIWARHLAYDATIYATAAVLEYRQMYAQAVDRGAPGFVGFNRFAHGRALAGPDYAPFLTPNADTLYSNAWLDLTAGPVLLEVPDTAGRYYTLNFLDIYGNATNISARVQGTRAARYLIATTDWQGPVPAGATVFRVSGPYMWILMRMFVTNKADIALANSLQDRFTIRATAQRSDGGPSFPDGHDSTPLGTLRIIDWVLRAVGHPQREDALVYRYQAIGIAGREPLDRVLADPEIRAGAEEGVLEANRVIEASVGRNGRRVGPWIHNDDVGRFGYNYLLRSAINRLGTGGNVDDENYAFTSFLDGEGKRLDGSTTTYDVTLAPPPPTRFFWSVTVYDARTRTLVPNPASRYLVNDRTPGLVRGADGSVSIHLKAVRPKGRSANWLPIPAGPFYVVIRAQGPGPDIAAGRWIPPPIRVVR